MAAPPSPPTSPAVKAVTGGGAFVSGAAALIALVAAFIHHGDPAPYVGGAAAFIGASSVFALGLVWHHHPGMSAWANREASRLPGLAAAAEPAIAAAVGNKSLPSTSAMMAAVARIAAAEAALPAARTKGVAMSDPAPATPAPIESDNPTGSPVGPAGVVRPVHPGDPGSPVDPGPGPATPIPAPAI